MSIVETNTTQVLEQVARFTAARHEVLATNVAHATTPGYERRDLDVEGFQAALQRILSPDAETVDPTSPGGSTNTPPRSVDPEVFVAKPDVERNVRFHDGGVRSVETEMTELVKNSMQHDLAIQLLSAQFDILEAIVSERA